MHVFVKFFSRFLTLFMVDITYVTIYPYKYTSKPPHFLTPSHILTLLLTLSPYESSSFPSFLLVLPQRGWFSCGLLLVLPQEDMFSGGFYFFADLVLPHCKCNKNYINKMIFYIYYFCFFIFDNFCIYFMIVYWINKFE